MIENEMEKESVKERVYAFLQHKGISIKRFEEQCGLSNGYVSSMRKGFGSEKLNNVLKEFPELSREWLLYGEGEMLSTTDSPEAAAPPADKLTQSLTTLIDTNATLVTTNAQLVAQLADLLQRIKSDKQ